MILFVQIILLLEKFCFLVCWIFFFIGNSILQSWKLVSHRVSIFIENFFLGLIISGRLSYLWRTSRVQHSLVALLVGCRLLLLFLWNRLKNNFWKCYLCLWLMISSHNSYKLTKNYSLKSKIILINFNLFICYNRNFFLREWEPFYRIKIWFLFRW